MGLPKDYPSQIWFNLVQRFQRRRFKYDFYQNIPNLHNLYKLAERKKMAAVTKNRNFFNSPLLLYYKSK
jgi:mannose/fructose/N-acetylgalactosamine-specific phosphotransferase system component IID